MDNKDCRMTLKLTINLQYEEEPKQEEKSCLNKIEQYS